MKVVAAAVLRARELLLVSKRAAPAVFYLPGGKPEPGEAPLDCLARELGEELGTGIASAEPFADVRAIAALEGVPMEMQVYLTVLAGTPAPAAEIAALRWWPRSRGLTLAPAVRDVVIPRLRAAGHLDERPMANRARGR